MQLHMTTLLDTLDPRLTKIGTGGKMVNARSKTVILLLLVYYVLVLAFLCTLLLFIGFLMICKCLLKINTKF